MDVVVAGGHGQVGLRLLRLLAGGGHRARGLVRNPDHVQDLADVGAEAVVCDMEALDDLSGCCQGADAVADHERVLEVRLCDVQQACCRGEPSQVRVDGSPTDRRSRNHDHPAGVRPGTFVRPCGGCRVTQEAHGDRELGGACVEVHVAGNGAEAFGSEASHGLSRVVEPAGDRKLRREPAAKGRHAP